MNVKSEQYSIQHTAHQLKCGCKETVSPLKHCIECFWQTCCFLESIWTKHFQPI